MPAHQQDDLTPLRSNLQRWLNAESGIASLHRMLLKNAELITAEELNACIESLKATLAEDWCPKLVEEKALVKANPTTTKPFEAPLRSWSNKRTNDTGAKLSYQRVALVSLAASSAACRIAELKEDLACGISVELGIEMPAESSITKGKLAGLVAAYIISTTLDSDHPEKLALHLMSALKDIDRLRLTATDFNYLASVEIATRYLKADRTIYAYYDLPVDEIYVAFNGMGDPDALIAKATPGHPLLIDAASLLGKSAFVQFIAHRLARRALQADSAGQTGPKVPFLIEIGPPGTPQEHHADDGAPYRSLAKLVSPPYPEIASHTEDPIERTLRAAFNLGSSAIVFIDGAQNAENQDALWAACLDLERKLPEASFVIATHQLPSSVIVSTPFLAKASRRKLTSLSEDQSEVMIRTYCIRFASDDCRPEEIEETVELARRNPYIKRMVMTPGKVMRYAHSRMTSPRKTVYEMIQDMAERKVEAFCSASPAAKEQAPWALSRPTMLSTLGILALNTILKGHVPEQIRIEGACSGHINAPDFPAIFKEALLKAIGGEPNAHFPQQKWLELAQSFVGRAGILAEHEGQIQFVSALEQAYVAARCMAAVSGLRTTNNDLALEGICSAVDAGKLRDDNFTADLVNMTLVSLASHGNAPEHERLTNALLRRCHAPGLTSEEAVRLLFILELSSRFDLGPTMLYAMEYLDEETGALMNTIQPVEDAIKLLWNLISKTKDKLRERHKQRAVQPNETLITAERLDYLEFTLSNKEDNE